MSSCGCLNGGLGNRGVVWSKPVLRSWDLDHGRDFFEIRVRRRLFMDRICVELPTILDELSVVS